MTSAELLERGMERAAALDAAYEGYQSADALLAHLSARLDAAPVVQPVPKAPESPPVLLADA